jgi:hypothetical protein
MADTETRAVIVLSAGKPIKVRETVEEILHALEAVTSRHIPVINVTDDRGTEHRINANQILEFHEPIEHGSAGFG